MLCLSWREVADSDQSRNMFDSVSIVLSFWCEAIKKEEKLSIAASKIDIFSQQDETLFVPSTSLLVAVVSMTCLLFGFSSFLFECLLRRTASGARKRR